MARLNLMNQDTFIDRLLEVGIIQRERRGWYTISWEDVGRLYSRRNILDIFGEEVAPGRYIFRREVIEALMQG